MNENEAVPEEESPVPLELVEQALVGRQPVPVHSSSVGPWPYLADPGAGSLQPVGDAEEPIIDTAESTVTRTGGEPCR